VDPDVNVDEAGIKPQAWRTKLIKEPRPLARRAPRAGDISGGLARPQVVQVTRLGCASNGAVVSLRAIAGVNRHGTEPLAERLKVALSESSEPWERVCGHGRTVAALEFHDREVRAETG
jgi:hypothetical protein